MNLDVFAFEDKKEREKLIEEASDFVCIPPPDYSKMSNDQIRKRIETMKLIFEAAFTEDEEDEEDI